MDGTHPNCGGRNGEGRVQTVQVEHEWTEVTGGHATHVWTPSNTEQYINKQNEVYFLYPGVYGGNRYTIY